MRAFYGADVSHNSPARIQIQTNATDDRIVGKVGAIEFEKPGCECAKPFHTHAHVLSLVPGVVDAEYSENHPVEREDCFQLRLAGALDVLMGNSDGGVLCHPRRFLFQDLSLDAKIKESIVRKHHSGNILQH